MSVRRAPARPDCSCNERSIVQVAQPPPHPITPSHYHLRKVKTKLLKFIPERLRNRYGLGIGVFLLYVCFLSDCDLHTTLKLRNELSEKRSEHEQYARDIKTVRAELAELNGDLVLLEKFAREKYKMKRDNEDVFVLVPKP